MKPFSAFYFTWKNRVKVLTVVIMIGLTSLLYIGGSYLTNIEVEYFKTIEFYKDFAYVFDNSEEAQNEIDQMKVDCEASGDTIKCMPAGGNDLRFPTTLGFKNSCTLWSFTLEDFLWINKRVHFLEDTSKLEDNTLIVTEREATFLGVQDGGEYKESTEKLSMYYGDLPYHVRTSQKDGFMGILVAKESASNETYIVTWGEHGNKEDFAIWKKEFLQKYPNLTVNTYEKRYQEGKDAFSINRLIFISIIVMVTCVFFITINAVLVGIYEKRKHEFLLYRYIGIPLRRIYWKVTSELLLITGMGMLLGLILSIITITLLNKLLYEPMGLHLYHLHPWSVYSWLTCNILIITPSILFRLRAIRKAEE